MLGAVNMGRGIGFQRRTGARARQMPGRPLGVRAPAAGLCTLLWAVRFWSFGSAGLLLLRLCTCLRSRVLHRVLII